MAIVLVKNGLDAIVNLVYPPACSLCQKKLLTKQEERLSICGGCFGKLKKNPPPYCKTCGRSLRGLIETIDTCRECSGKNFYYDKSWSCMLYEGMVKEVLHLLKYSKKLSLSALFCDLVIQFLKANPDCLNNIDGLVAVPLHSVRLREREFNQAHMLVKAILKEFHITDLSICLKRTIPTRPQNELDKNERFKNVKGTFGVIRNTLVQDKNLLLVDDLFTTGATLNECAKALKQAGAKKISCLTFARGT